MSDFVVGQKVVIFGNSIGGSFSEVTRVTKRFVETRGGSKWNHQGSPYPREKWNRTFIKSINDVPTPTLEAIDAQNRARYLHNVVWKDLPNDVLRQVMKLVRENVK
jgi:hypothetical protein